MTEGHIAKLWFMGTRIVLFVSTRIVLFFKDMLKNVVVSYLIDSFFCCFLDGKNHAPCCHRRGLDVMCSDFCVGKVPTDLDEKHLICMNNTFDILMCYEEGQSKLIFVFLVL